jgi:hypothetical protein
MDKKNRVDRNILCAHKVVSPKKNDIFVLCVKKQNMVLKRLCTWHYFYPFYTKYKKCRYTMKLGVCIWNVETYALYFCLNFFYHFKMLFLVTGAYAPMRLIRFSRRLQLLWSLDSCNNHLIEGDTYTRSRCRRRQAAGEFMSTSTAR